MQQLILMEARTWIGTRFAHQGRCRATQTHSGGVDCLGLLMGIAGALGLADKHSNQLISHDRQDYSTTPNGDRLRDALSQALYPVADKHIALGDIALFSYEGNAQHLGIISDYHGGALGLIHAYAPAKRVVEHRLDTHWREKIAAAYRLPANY